MQAPAYTFSTLQYPSRSNYYGELNFCGACHGFLESPFIYTGLESTSIYQWDADMYTQNNIGILYALTQMTWLKLKVQWILLLILLILEETWVLISVYSHVQESDDGCVCLRWDGGSDSCNSSVLYECACIHMYFMYTYVLMTKCACTCIHMYLWQNLLFGSLISLRFQFK